MNRQFKYVLLHLIILALSVSACNSLSVEKDQPANSHGVEPPTNAQLEIRSLFQDRVSDAEDTPSLEELDGVNRSVPIFSEGDMDSQNDSVNLKDSDSEESTEVIQVDQFPGIAPEFADASQAEDPEDIPSLEERNAMFDLVNRGGLVFPESDQAPVGEGPPPGTESFLAPGVQPDDILDRVNQGGPILPGSEETVGEGPSPGTESVIGDAESSSNSTDDTGLHFVAKFVEMLRDWFQEVFDL